MKRTLRLVLAGCAALLAVAALSSSAARADDGARAHERCRTAALESRVLDIRFRAVTDAAPIVDQLLGPCGSYRVPKGLGVIVVEDEPAVLDRVKTALAAWDVPPPTVEVSVSLVLASREPPAPGGIREDLQDVSETLSRITRWTNYTRVGSAVLRVVAGGTAQADLGDRYRVSFRVDAVDRDLGVVRLEPFDLLRMPHPDEVASGTSSPQLLLANSVVNVFEGRLNLVGAGSRHPERALFVALEVFSRDAADAGAAALGD